MTDGVVDTQAGVSDPGPEAQVRSHKWTWKKWVLAIGLGLFAVLFLYYAVTLI